MIKIIDNNLINALAMNNEMVKLYPFIKQSNAANSSKCGACGQTPQTEHNSIKMAIAQLSAEQAKPLKQYLHADKLRVIYKVGNDIQDTIF